MYSNILIPVLIDEDYDPRASFAAARALAGGSAKFTVMHVLEAIPGFVSFQISADVLAATHREAERLLAESAKGLPGAATHLISGHPGRDIVGYADENDIDCIVITSHRPGLEDYFLGSTASRVVRHAQCAVHVIR